MHALPPTPLVFKVCACSSISEAIACAKNTFRIVRWKTAPRDTWMRGGEGAGWRGRRVAEEGVVSQGRISMESDVSESRVGLGIFTLF